MTAIISRTKGFIFMKSPRVASETTTKLLVEVLTHDHHPPRSTGV